MSEAGSGAAGGPNGSGEAAAQPGGEAKAPQFRVLGQFVKDLSFENPGAPDTLAGGATSPNVDIAVDVQSRRRDGDVYECDLRVNASAKRDDKPVFVAELVYSGVFQLSNLPQESVEPVLLVECPRILFPFARRVLADVTQDGGFPPLMLEPIDFLSLYRNQIRQRQQAQEAGSGAPPEGGSGSA